MKGRTPLPASGYRTDLYFRIGDAHQHIVPGPYDIAACWTGDGKRWEKAPGLLRVWSLADQTTQWPNTAIDLALQQQHTGPGLDDWDRWVRKYVAPGDVFAIPSSWGPPPNAATSPSAAIVACWNNLAAYVGAIAWQSDGTYIFTPSAKLPDSSSTTPSSTTPSTPSSTTPSSTTPSSSSSLGTLIGGALFVIGGVATSVALAHRSTPQPRGRGERTLVSANPRSSISLERVQLDRYGYVRSGYSRGRYFGVGEPLYRADNEDTGDMVYFRARDRVHANAIVRAGWSAVLQKSRGG